MNERRQDINSILKDLFISARSNRVYLTQRIVYDYLIKCNVRNRDLDKNINYEYDSSLVDKQSDRNFFGRWIDGFRNIQNINVFCADNWKYFCQFIGGNGRNIDPRKCVKLYIPLDYDHLYQGVKSIFSFLTANNISHMSKVSSHIRFDNVVVRLSNLEDARLLQEFIDGDRYIQSGLIRVNSFGFERNGVGYGYDGYLSYNMCVSKIIASYINANIDANIDDINFENFLFYVDSFSKDYNKVASLADNSSYRSDAFCVV